MSRSSSNDLGGQVGSAVFLLGLALLLIAFYITFVLVRMVIRMFVLHPKNKYLWGSLGLLLLFGSLAALTHGNPALISLAGISLWLLILTAYAVQLYYDELFQREQSKETLIADVLQRPWWQEGSPMPQAA